MQILECVAVNLTILYALLAYSNIKQKDFNNVYVRASPSLYCKHSLEYDRLYSYVHCSVYC